MILARGKVTSEAVFVILSRNLNTETKPVSEKLWYKKSETVINPLNAKLNPICYLLALLAHHFLHVNRIRVKSLILRLLMSYIYMEHLFLMFLDHTQRRTTFGRTPPDEWSARRRDLYLTTHDNHNRNTSMPPVGFEPTFSAGERPQTYALVRAATGTNVWDSTGVILILKFFSVHTVWT